MARRSESKRRPIDLPTDAEVDRILASCSPVSALGELIAVEKRAAEAKAIRQYADVTHLYQHFRDTASDLSVGDGTLRIAGDTASLTITGANEEAAEFADAMRLAAIKWLEERIAYREQQFAAMELPAEVPV